jgi:hypothetical protein
MTEQQLEPWGSRPSFYTHLNAGIATPEIVEDQRDIAAAETPRRPRGLRRLSFIDWGRLYGTVSRWQRMAIVKASRNDIFQRLRNLYLWRYLQGSVETTQSVCDNGSKAHNGGSSPKRQGRSDLHAPPASQSPSR